MGMEAEVLFDAPEREGKESVPVVEVVESIASVLPANVGV
jgi:hypothetical protein